VIVIGFCDRVGVGWMDGDAVPFFLIQTGPYRLPLPFYLTSSRDGCVEHERRLEGVAGRVSRPWHHSNLSRLSTQRVFSKGSARDVQEHCQQKTRTFANPNPNPKPEACIQYVSTRELEDQDNVVHAKVSSYPR
jgi:hypothetical protein